MKRKGKHKTSLVKEYRFVKDEMAILDPLYKKKKEYDRAIQDFVGRVVTKRLDLDPNQKWSIRFNVQEGWIRVKRIGTEQIINRDPRTAQDVLGWGD